MVKIKKEFLNNYDILQLNTDAKTFNEIAKKDSDDYIFTPLPSSGNEDLITSILRKSKEVNHSLLNSWEDKPWADDEIYNTANSYLINQFESSKLSIKNEIPITGEDTAKMRFSLLLTTYLPILVAHLTLHYKYPGGYDIFIKALTWDDDTIFLPLPVNENGLIIWDDIFDKNEDKEEVEQNPITYDATKIEELIENLYERLSKELDNKLNSLKAYIDRKLESNKKNVTEKINNIRMEFDKIIPNGISEAYNKGLEESPKFKEEVVEDNSLKEENTKLKKEVKLLKNKIEVLSHDNKDLMKSNSEHDDIVSGFQDEIKNLKNTIKLLNEDSDKYVERDTNYDIEIANYKREISDLKEELEKVKSESPVDEESSAIIGVKDNEIAELKQELETRKENEKLLRDRNAELEEGDNTLRKELNKVNEDNVNLNRELSSLQNEISSYIDSNRELERANEKLTASNKDLEKNVKDLEKELASIKKENGIDELEKIKEDNRILRQALEDLKHKKDNEKYIAKELPKEVEDNPVSDKDPEVIAREKANRDRIGRMIYGDAYDGTQTF